MSNIRLKIKKKFGSSGNSKTVLIPKHVINEWNTKKYILIVEDGKVSIYPDYEGKEIEQNEP